MSRRITGCFRIWTSTANYYFQLVQIRSLPGAGSKGLTSLTSRIDYRQPCRLDSSSELRWPGPSFDLQASFYSTSLSLPLTLPYAAGFEKNCANYSARSQQPW